jgi:hypothetical protein
MDVKAKVELAKLVVDAVYQLSKEDQDDTIPSWHSRLRAANKVTEDQELYQLLTQLLFWPDDAQAWARAILANHPS